MFPLHQPLQGGGGERAGRRQDPVSPPGCGKDSTQIRWSRRCRTPYPHPGSRAAHRGVWMGRYLFQVQQALGDGDQRAVILPGIPRVTVFLGHLALQVVAAARRPGAPMLRRRSAVQYGNQTLGSHEVHVGGCGHGAGDSSPGGAANLAVAAEVRLAVPWPRTTSAAPRRHRRRGRGALPTRRAPGRPPAPHLCVTGSASTRAASTAPGSAALPPLAAADAQSRARSPPTGAPATPASSLPWKDATYGGRKFIRPKTPPRRWERKLPERYALGCLSVEPKPQDFHPTTWTRVASAGRSAGSKRFACSPLTASEPLLLPVRTDAAFSHAVTICTESHHVTIRTPPIGQWEGDSTLFTFSRCQSERPFGGEGASRTEARGQSDCSVSMRKYYPTASER